MRAIAVIAAVLAFTFSLLAAPEQQKPVKTSLQGVLLSITTQAGAKESVLAQRDGDVYAVAYHPALASLAGREVYIEGSVSKVPKKGAWPEDSIQPEKVYAVASGRLLAERFERADQTSAVIESPDGVKCQLAPDPAVKALLAEREGSEVCVGGSLIPATGSDAKLWKMRLDPKCSIPSSSVESLERAAGRRVAERIPEEKLKPGALISVPLPGLGKSLSSAGGRPIEMLVMLPLNYAKNRKHPVIVHFGFRLGRPGDASPWFDSVTERKNFIVVGMDYPYSSGNERRFPRDDDFMGAVYGLAVLEASTAIDRSAVVLAGNDNGGYSICFGLPSSNAKYFAAFCMINGASIRTWSSVLPPAAKKPVLMVSGENDESGPRNGFACKDLMNECFTFMKNMGCKDAELFIEPGAKHEWRADAYPVQREWLYKKIPSIAKYGEWSAVVADASKPLPLRALNVAWLSEESWFDYPLDDSVRFAIEKFKADEAAKAKGQK